MSRTPTGETTRAIAGLVGYALTTPDSTCLYVASTHHIAEATFRRTVEALPNNGVRFIANRSKMSIEFSNGSAIFFRRNDPEQWRGYKIDHAAMDLV